MVANRPLLLGRGFPLLIQARVGARRRVLHPVTRRSADATHADRRSPGAALRRYRASPAGCLASAELCEQREIVQWRHIPICLGVGRGEGRSPHVRCSRAYGDR